MSKFLRVSVASLGRNKCSLILINQVRTNLGTNSKYVTTTTTGGLAIPFYATQRVELRKERIEASDPISEEDGIKIRCKITKNRLAKKNPFKTCHYYALYGVGIDSVAELGNVLVKENIVRQKGAWISYTDKAGVVLPIKTSEKEYNGKWNGVKAFSTDIKEDVELREFFEKILNQYLITGRCGKSLSADEIKEIESEENRMSKELKEIDNEATEVDDEVAMEG